jgi:DNA-binding response OmpR family regulator
MATPHVLIVDDSPTIVALLTDYLKEAKPEYSVEAAFNAADGLLAAGRNRPDLILLDVNMPGLDGVDALEQIQQIDNTIAVIMITASHHVEATRALGRGAVACLPKPFEMKYLGHLIDLALASRPRSFDHSRS